LFDIYIFNKNFDKINELFEKVDIIKKQIRDDNMILRYDIIKYCVEIFQGETKLDDENKLRFNITSQNSDLFHSYSYWYLALSFSKEGLKKEAEKYLTISQKIIIDTSDILRDKKLKKAFLNTNPIFQLILSHNKKSITEFSHLLEKTKKEVNISKFCSECGFKNQEFKSFCPECGNQLRI
jgi:hypothetical protein